MNGVELPKLTGEVKEARYVKDWLPCFSRSMSEDFKELENFRKIDNNQKQI